MNVLKESGSYLDDQAKGNLYLAIIIFIIGVVGLLLSYFITNFCSAYIFLIILGVSGFFLKNFINYSGGSEAEKLVSLRLQELDNRYYLLNDVKLPNIHGNIDHIVLGPNGIFVIETKNLEGEIRCDGDSWYQYKPEWKKAEEYEIRSPSKQVKGNALKLKQFIDSKKIFNTKRRLWIEGIVVFTNKNTKLSLNAPTVPVLKIEELCSWIKHKQSDISFFSKELEAIGKAILQQA